MTDENDSYSNESDYYYDGDIDEFYIEGIKSIAEFNKVNIDSLLEQYKQELIQDAIKHIQSLPLHALERFYDDDIGDRHDLPSLKCMIEKVSEAINISQMEEKDFALQVQQEALDYFNGTIQILDILHIVYDYAKIPESTKLPLDTLTSLQPEDLLKIIKERGITVRRFSDTMSKTYLIGLIVKSDPQYYKTS